MRTIAQQLNVKDFPFTIKDKNGRIVYFEESDKCWHRYEYDSNGNQIYFENSKGYWTKRGYGTDGSLNYFEDSEGRLSDNRPKGCEGKVVEIDGKKYKLTEFTS